MPVVVSISNNNYSTTDQNILFFQSKHFSINQLLDWPKPRLRTLIEMFIPFFLAGYEISHRSHSYFTTVVL